jgi:hypothetical protein
MKKEITEKDVQSRIEKVLKERNLYDLARIMDREHNLLRSAHRKGIILLGDLMDAAVDDRTDQDVLYWDEEEKRWKAKVFSGGSMQQHGNEYHDPDMSLAVHNHDGIYAPIASVLTHGQIMSRIFLKV